MSEWIFQRWFSCHQKCVLTSSPTHFLSSFCNAVTCSDRHVIREIRWTELFGAAVQLDVSISIPLNIFVPFFSRRSQTASAKTSVLNLPPPQPNPSLSVGVSPHLSLSFCLPSLSHPIPDIFPPLSYVCKCSHGNCRTACLATGFILSLGKNGGTE